MPAAVNLLQKFRRRLKRLRRKYPAVTVEVSKLVTELENDKRPGFKLAGFGFDLYKVRLPNPSAQRGKSGGFRVVYYVQFVDLITSSQFIPSPKRAISVFKRSKA